MFRVTDARGEDANSRAVPLLPTYVELTASDNPLDGLASFGNLRSSVFVDVDGDSDKDRLVTTSSNYGVITYQNNTFEAVPGYVVDGLNWAADTGVRGFRTLSVDGYSYL